MNINIILYHWIIIQLTDMFVISVEYCHMAFIFLIQNNTLYSFGHVLVPNLVLAKPCLIKSCYIRL